MNRYSGILLIIIISMIMESLCKVTLSYEPEIAINLNKSNSLHCVKITSNSSEFYPSYYGGISVNNSKGEIFHPWSHDVKFKLLKRQSDVSKVFVEWIMYKDNDFYFHYSVSFKKSQNKLIVHFKDMGEFVDNSLPSYYAKACAFYLDRCEGADNPVIIAVPYLTMFNILFANNCFVSMYFDWNKTKASQIIPYNNKSFSNTSEYYSQYAIYNSLTNGERNKLDETIYLKVSDNLDDVLPDLPNPISKYKEESSGRIVFDDWYPFNESISNITKISQNGIKHVWHIVHNWQRYGYDVALPDVFPANPNFGGNNELIALSEYNKKAGNLFSLHENYIDIFKSSSKFRAGNLALNPQGHYIFNWYNGDSSFIVKPTKIFENLIPISKQINNTFKTTAAYHDVSASYDPSKYVDYDYREDGAGKFITPYNIFKSLADTLKNIHNGPVSSEGLAHFLYIGYYDDICAQIHTAKSLPGSYGTETEGGYYKPLLVNFDLLKMKEKAMVHGVGYFERFFYKNRYWQYMGWSRDSALMYAATELAYGHGAFFSTSTYNFIEQGMIEYNYVFPVQQKYSESQVSKILYNDNGRLITASDYIRKYPFTFDKFGDTNFMSQVFVEYENGLKIYVNRHTFKDWEVDFSGVSGFYSFHSQINNKDSLYAGNMIGSKFTLPSNNGWLCYYIK